ncbi:MAG: ATPase, partial [Angelakisella sp.]
ITTGQKAKNAVLFNLCAFVGVAALMVILPIGSMVTAFAAEAAPAAAAAVSTGAGMGFLAAALVTGLSCIGSGIAVA